MSFWEKNNVLTLNNTIYKYSIGKFSLFHFICFTYFFILPSLCLPLSIAFVWRSWMQRFPAYIFESALLEASSRVYCQQGTITFMFLCSNVGDEPVNWKIKVWHHIVQQCYNTVCYYKHSNNQMKFKLDTTLVFFKLNTCWILDYWSDKIASFICFLKCL